MDRFSQSTSQETAAVSISRFMSRIYGWMTFGLMITAVTGYVIGNDQALTQMFLANRLVMMVAIILQFALVIGLSSAITRLSVGAATAGFLLFSFVTGITLSSIFLIYSIDTIGQVFAITAGAFAGLAIFGYVTKKDLSGVGTFMVMGLWGIIIASLVNLFLHSSALDYALSVASVFVFSGLTAYHVQQLKSMGASGDIESDTGHKNALMGALILYLDFINLFLALLRLFGGGRRRD